MKKLLLMVVFLTAIVFASNDINKKLDLLIQKIEQLEKKVDLKDKEIEKLKQELKKQEKQTKEKFAIKSCDKIEVVDIKSKYYDEVIPYYQLQITLKNNYPKEVTYIRGKVYAEDKDRVKILQVFLDRNIDIKPNQKVTINKKHLLENDLEKYFKDEDVKNLKIYFAPTRIEFKDGKILECN